MSILHQSPLLQHGLPCCDLSQSKQKKMSSLSAHVSSCDPACSCPMSLLATLDDCVRSERAVGKRHHCSTPHAIDHSTSLFSSQLLWFFVGQLHFLDIGFFRNSVVFQHSFQIDVFLLVDDTGCLRSIHVEFTWEASANVCKIMFSPSAVATSSSSTSSQASNIVIVSLLETCGIWS